MLTDSGGHTLPCRPLAAPKHKKVPMPDFSSRVVALTLCAAVLIGGVPSAFAQSGGKGAEQKPATPGEVAKEGQKKVDEIAEAERLVTGAAGKPECVWLGRRVVSLLWRDDLDTAFRHLDLYDRFGCPGGHIQSTFRCVVRHGNIDPKVPESLNSRVHSCWLDPNQQAAASATPPAAAAPATGAVQTR